MVNYKNIVEKYQEKNIEMNTISEEIIKLKFEAKQEATLIITTRLKELIENQDEPKNNIAQEYNLYLKVTGFTELEKKLKDIITLNRNLTMENGKLQYQLEKLSQKYKLEFKEKKNKIKKHKKRNG